MGKKKKYKLRVKVPPDVRKDPDKLRAFLEDMAKDLQDSLEVDIADQGGGGAKSVNVTMNVRPCGART